MKRGAPTFAPSKLDDESDLRGNEPVFFNPVFYDSDVTTLVFIGHAQR